MAARRAKPNRAKRPSRVLIVDGYNVARSTGAYDDVGPDDYSGGPGLNAIREKLIADVATFAQGDFEATLVFDGGGNPESTGDPVRRAGVQVVFSPSGTEADQVIEALAHREAAKGRGVLVVTSDAATQWTVLHENVRRMSAVAFVEEVRALNASWHERNPSPKVKNTLAERIDPAALSGLERLLR